MHTLLEGGGWNQSASSCEYLLSPCSPRNLCLLVSSYEHSDFRSTSQVLFLPLRRCMYLADLREQLLGHNDHLFLPSGVGVFQSTAVRRPQRCGTINSSHSNNAVHGRHQRILLVLVPLSQEQLGPSTRPGRHHGCCFQYLFDYLPLYGFLR